MRSKKTFVFIFVVLAFLFLAGPGGHVVSKAVASAEKAPALV